MTTLVPEGYALFLADLKSHIHAAQVKAALSVNRELIALYFEVRREPVEKRDRFLWGDDVIGQIAHLLNSEFPLMTGFSKRNFNRMQAFYRAYAGCRSNCVTA